MFGDAVPPSPAAPRGTCPHVLLPSVTSMLRRQWGGENCLEIIVCLHDSRLHLHFSSFEQILYVDLVESTFGLTYTRARKQYFVDLWTAYMHALYIRDGHGLGPSMGWVGLGSMTLWWVGFIHGFGWVQWWVGCNNWVTWGLLARLHFTPRTLNWWKK